MFITLYIYIATFFHIAIYTVPVHGGNDILVMTLLSFFTSDGPHNVCTFHSTPISRDAVRLFQDYFRGHTKRCVLSFPTDALCHMNLTLFFVLRLFLTILTRLEIYLLNGRAR